MLGRQQILGAPGINPSKPEPLPDTQRPDESPGVGGKRRLPGQSVKLWGLTLSIPQGMEKT